MAKLVDVIGVLNRA